MGFVGLLGNKETKESESHVVRGLRAAGALLFVKTNVPSGMMVSGSESTRSLHETFLFNFSLFTSRTLHSSPFFLPSTLGGTNFVPILLIARRLGSLILIYYRLKAVETNNNIVGYTSNAYNRNLSACGSSGGKSSNHLFIQNPSVEYTNKFSEHFQAKHP